MKRLIVVALPLLAGCGGSLATVEVTRVPGDPALIRSEAAEPLEISALRARAATDLACADLTLERRRSSEVFRASGCERRTMYLRTQRSDSRPLERPPLSITDVEFVNLATTDSLGAEADQNDTVLHLALLDVQGALDLGCPRSEVTPEFVSSGRSIYTPTAEGCGKRATYLPVGYHDTELRLAAVVPAPGAPTGFAPWVAEDRAYHGHDAVVLHVDSDDPGATHIERVGDANLPALCTAPCDLAVDPKLEYRVAGGWETKASGPFRVQPGAPKATARVSVARDRSLTALVLGSTALGPLITGVTFVTIPSDPSSPPDPTFHIVGGVMLTAGVVLLVTAIALTVDWTSVSVTP